MQGSEVFFYFHRSGLLEQHGQCIAPVFTVMWAICLESQYMSGLYVSSSVVYKERFGRVDSGISYQKVENPPVRFGNSNLVRQIKFVEESVSGFPFDENSGLHAQSIT